MRHSCSVISSGKKRNFDMLSSLVAVAELTVNSTKVRFFHRLNCFIVDPYFPFDIFRVAQI